MINKSKIFKLLKSGEEDDVKIGAHLLLSLPFPEICDFYSQYGDQPSSTLISSKWLAYNKYGVPKNRAIIKGEIVFIVGINGTGIEWLKDFENDGNPHEIEYYDSP